MNSAVETMLRKLGPGYFIGQDEISSGNLFSLWKRNAPGTYNPKTEPRDVRIGALKPRDWMAFDRTSPHTDEIADRMILLIVHGQDTTRMGQRQQIDERKLDELVQEKVAALLKTQVEKLVQERDRIDTIAKQAANDIVVKETMPPAPSKAVKSGIQFKPKKAPLEYAKERDEKNAMWAERGKILGIGEPVIRTTDKHIDGRWLRRAQALWDAHVAKNPVAAE